MPEELLALLSDADGVDFDMPVSLRLAIVSDARLRSALDAEDDPLFGALPADDVPLFVAVLPVFGWLLELVLDAFDDGELVPFG